VGKVHPLTYQGYMECLPPTPYLPISLLPNPCIVRAFRLTLRKDPEELRSCLSLFVPLVPLDGGAAHYCLSLCCQP
jgi:hypothetical protein